MDDELVSEDWLREIGFEEIESAHSDKRTKWSTTFRLKIHGFMYVSAEFWRSKGGKAAAIDFVPFRTETLHAGSFRWSFSHIPTRYQVECLLHALDPGRFDNPLAKKGD